MPHLWLARLFREGMEVKSVFEFAREFFGPSFTWSHLWFLVILFSFIPFHMPIFWYLLPRSPRTQQPYCATITALVFLLNPVLVSSSPYVAALLFAVAVIFVAMTFSKRVCDWDVWITAVVFWTHVSFIAIMAHILKLDLAVTWGMMYGCIVAAATIIPHVSSRVGGYVSVVCIVLAAIAHVAGLAGPPYLPLPRDLGVVLGLRIVDMLLMLSHFASFFTVGFACAAFAPAIQPTFTCAWLGPILLVVFPLLFVTLPPEEGYIILLGNFPTYAQPIARWVYHGGAWLWVGMISALASFLCSGSSPNEAVEQYLSRFSMTLYTTHILWIYLFVFPIRWVVYVLGDWHILPLLLLCILEIGAAHIFHHFVVLRSPIAQLLFGVK